MPRIAVVLIALSTFSTASLPAADTLGDRPNIVFFLADDKCERSR